jgi:IS5 family transposase
VQINALLAANAWNLKKMMKKIERIFFAFYFSTLFSEKFNIPHDTKEIFKERLNI